MRPRTPASALLARRLTLAALAAVASTACRREGEVAPAAGTEERAAVVALEPAFTRVTDRMLGGTDAAGENWPTHGGAYNNQRYSTLDQINRENVADLVPVWIHQTGIAESFATTPIVVDNTMYFTTAESHVVALNAATGERLWTYVPELETTMLCCGPDNRGVAVHDDKVFVATLDARLIALNNRTGQVMWEAQIADPDDGYSETMAPLAYDGKVVVGVDGGEYGIRGFVAAYDAKTGKEVWRWYTIPAPGDGGAPWWGQWKPTDPYGTSLGRDILFEREALEDRRDAWERGGGAVTTTPAYDPATNTLYVVVDNPAPALDGAARPGDNLYTGSIVALDGRTGKMRWYFQYLPHDVWDLSGGSPPFLFHDGARKFVGHAGRTGWLYVVDAATGRPVLRSDNFVPQANLFVHPNDEGIRLLPGANGGADWSPTAYSPRTGLVYVTALHQPMIYTRAYQPREDGRLWIGGRFLHVPNESQSGTLSAIDPRTGEIRWQRQLPAPTSGGTLATAGDIVFVGQGTGTFDAFDAQTGALLWQFRAGAGVNGSPITYMAGGVQYVAVAAGGNYQLDTPRGDDLIVFALHARRPQTPVRDYAIPRYTRNGAIHFGRVRQVPAAQVEQRNAARSRARRP
ncbi:MAG TPA: PQQ-binding-like beta-propeller repeat protein [Longimicrobiales bacterium]